MTIILTIALALAALAGNAPQAKKGGVLIGDATASDNQAKQGGVLVSDSKRKGEVLAGASATQGWKR